MPVCLTFVNSEKLGEGSTYICHTFPVCDGNKLLLAMMSGSFLPTINYVLSEQLTFGVAQEQGYVFQ